MTTLETALIVVCAALAVAVTILVFLLAYASRKYSELRAIQRFDSAVLKERIVFVRALLDEKKKIDIQN